MEKADGSEDSSSDEEEKLDSLNTLAADHSSILRPLQKPEKKKNDIAEFL